MSFSTLLQLFGLSIFSTGIVLKHSSGFLLSGLDFQRSSFKKFKVFRNQGLQNSNHSAQLEFQLEDVFFPF
jgi:hypothetical protein